MIRFSRLARTARRGVALGSVGLLGIACSTVLGFEELSTAKSDGGFDAGPPIIIGVTHAGSANDTSAALQNAVKLAESQLNDAGGILGRHVTFKIVDGASLTVNVNSLLDEHPVAFLGPAGNDEALSLVASLGAKKVLQISATATAPELTAGNKYFFRTIPSADVEARALALYAQTRVGAGEAGTGCRKMAILHSDDGVGTAFARSVTTTFVERGGVVVKDMLVPSDVKASYQTELAALLGASPECLAAIVDDATGDPFLRELRAAQKANPAVLSPEFFVVGTARVYTTSFIVNGRTDKSAPSSPTIAEGVFGTSPDPNPDTAEYSEFKKSYVARFPLAGETDLQLGVAGIYDAAILAALAVEQAGSTDDGAKIRDALFSVSAGGTKKFGPTKIAEALAAIRAKEDIDYVGASGGVDFDSNGAVTGDYIVWKVENGTFKTVQRIRASELP